MKESNLLIFRDYSIKLGEFRLSIKLKDTVLGGDSDKYSLKGLTPGYVIGEIESSFNSKDKV
jgi:hypothetical protein